MKWYSGRYDRAFKEVMLKENNQDILKLLIEKILEIKIKDMRILNNERLKSNVHVKGQRLDLILSTDIGKINVEVNSHNEKYVHYRNMAYLCDIYAHDTLVGEDYPEKVKYIQINLTYQLGKEFEKIRKYQMKDNENHFYIENFEIYDVNMDYYMGLWYNKKERESNENAVLVMLGLEREELTKFSRKNGMVLRYMDELNRVNEEPEFREYMSYEEDQRKITNSLVKESMRKGIEQGMEKGIEKGKQEEKRNMIKSMIENGMSKEDIMKYCDISEEEFFELEL